MDLISGTGQSKRGEYQREPLLRNTNQVTDHYPNNKKPWYCKLKNILWLVVIVLLIATISLSLSLYRDRKMQTMEGNLATQIGALQGNKAVKSSGGTLKLKADPLTIGNINGREIEFCGSNEMKRSFPDFDYALYGYNIVFGYPLAVGHDPGLTRPIFVADYSNSKRTADCRYQIPKGYNLAPDVSCVTSFSSEEISNSRQFTRELSTSANIGGGGWGVSFSASASYKEKESFMSTGKSIYIISTASCNYYFSQMKEENPPSLTKDFIEYTKKLKNTDDVFKFFKYYGTHFMTYTLFGARFVYENKMKQESTKTESETGYSLSAQASYSGAFSLSGGFSMSSSQRKAAEDFQSKVETTTVSIGAPPPADGNTMTWASTVKDTPVPVKYKLREIDELFTPAFMKDVSDFRDYERVRKLIKKSKPLYCRYLTALGNIDSCKLGMDMVFFSEIKITGGGKDYNYTKKECDTQCTGEDRCFAYEYRGAKGTFDHQCWLYRTPETSRLRRIISNRTIETMNGLNNYHNHFHKQEVGVVIFFDALSQYKYTFEIKETRVKPGIRARESIRVRNQRECEQRCRDDKVCHVVNYNKQTNDAYENNCNLFTTDRLKCHSSVKWRDCEILETAQGKYESYVLVFNP
uniref:MACPF domain-containing protein n=2 Tax=Clytia hemisphaerica TaxID=252671 RepID=A0A7M5XDS4_9CNID